MSYGEHEYLQYAKAEMDFMLHLTSKAGDDFIIMNGVIRPFHSGVRARAKVAVP